MSDINITIPGGSSKRLMTEGKYCDKNIVVTAEGGSQENLDSVLSEQEALITTLQATLMGKAAVQRIDSGSFVLDYDTANDYFVAHNLGQIPSFAFLFVEGVEDSTKWAGYIINITHIHDRHINAGATRFSVYYRLYGKADGSGFTANAVYVNDNPSCTDTELCFMADASRKLRAGVKYKWVCGIIDGLN